jgi:hypothetical protein
MTLRPRLGCNSLNLLATRLITLLWRVVVVVAGAVVVAAALEVF